MEIDNIIYIVITIVIFVVSLLGQSKKKKIEKKVVEDDVIYSLNDFEKILLRKEEFRNAENILDKSNVNEINIEEKIKQEKNESNPHHVNEEKEADDGFDIKSAVIYSSILERKKFKR